MKAVPHPPSPWSELVHRWFVQYNPLYLVSAALVLVGVVLVSKGLARRDGMLSELWLTAITELYQALLIAAVALLYRRGLRRPALMLALLEVVYLGDLTFQTGVAPWLGGVGWLVSAAWLALALLKIAVMAWALSLRLSLSAALLLCLGVASLTVLPHLLHARVLADAAAERLLVFWLFGVTAAGLWARPSIHSGEELGAWGETVRRRAVRASLVVWLGLLLGHAIWWSIDYRLDPALGLLCAAILLSAHFARGEVRAWMLIGWALGMGRNDPGWLSAVALMGAVVLGLRAWRRRALPMEVEAPHGTVELHPYRAASAAPAPAPAGLLVAPAAAEARRSLALALGSLHLSIWTMGWQGGALPAHQIGLDLALLALLIPLAWRGGRVLPLLLAGTVFGHLAVQRGVLAAPSSTLQWGALVLVLGFALLLVGFAIDWLARPRATTERGARATGAG